jgi:hypothetical protein
MFHKARQSDKQSRVVQTYIGKYKFFSINEQERKYQFIIIIYKYFKTVALQNTYDLFFKRPFKLIYNINYHTVKV